MTVSESKTTEFARLVEFFDQLASRKTSTRVRGGTNTAAASEDRNPYALPADLIPIVKRLATVIGTRKPATAQTVWRKKTSIQGSKKNDTTALHDTHDTVTNEDDRGYHEDYPVEEGRDDESGEEEDLVSLAKFPLGRRYPFTFKMMHHKLYQREDWRRKVKDILKQSQMDYKPLAECEKQVEEPVEGVAADGDTEGNGRVHFQAGTAPTGPRQGHVAPLRLRSRSVSAVGTAGTTAFEPASPIRSPATKELMGDESRVVKKRCVGRRKSVSGPMIGEGVRIGGNWVYDAAVASIENASRGREGETLLPGKRHFIGADFLAVNRENASRRKRHVSTSAVGASKTESVIRSSRIGNRPLARRRALSAVHPVEEKRHN